MPNAISNTSPLLYLYRVGVLEWLQDIFGEVLVPEGVVEELREGRRLGFDAPNPEEYVWMRLVNPTSMPSEWLSLDLGPGELAAMALALENRECIVLLDDMLARKTAKAAGLHVWGTLKVLLEGKAQGLTSELSVLIDRLDNAGMWLSQDILERILVLAGESAMRPSRPI